MGKSFARGYSVKELNMKSFNPSAAIFSLRQLSEKILSDFSNGTVEQDDAHDMAQLFLEWNNWIERNNYFSGELINGNRFLTIKHNVESAIEMVNISNNHNTSISVAELSLRAATRCLRRALSFLTEEPNTSLAALRPRAKIQFESLRGSHELV